MLRERKLDCDSGSGRQPRPQPTRERLGAYAGSHVLRAGSPALDCHDCHLSTIAEVRGTTDSYATSLRSVFMANPNISDTRLTTPITFQQADSGHASLQAMLAGKITSQSFNRGEVSSQRAARKLSIVTGSRSGSLHDANGESCGYGR